MPGASDTRGSTAAGSCAYCLEPLNAGASVCRACGRKQPPSAETIAFRWRGFWALSATAVLVAGVGVWIWQRSERDFALSDAKLAASFCHPLTRAEEAEAQVTQLHDSGMSWRDAAHSFRVLIGCDFSGQ